VDECPRYVFIVVFRLVGTRPVASGKTVQPNTSLFSRLQQGRYAEVGVKLDCQ
jgi:hypothetical protein